MQLTLTMSKDLLERYKNVHDNATNFDYVKRFIGKVLAPKIGLLGVGARMYATCHVACPRPMAIGSVSAQNWVLCT